MGTFLGTYAYYLTGVIKCLATLVAGGIASVCRHMVYEKLSPHVLYRNPVLPGHSSSLLLWFLVSDLDFSLPSMRPRRSGVC